MATYYVDSTKTGGANTGGSWTNAFLTFAQAANTAANTDGDVIRVAHNHTETFTAETTYTFLANIAVICTNSGTDLPTTGAEIVISNTQLLTLAGARNIKIVGVRFATGGSQWHNATQSGHFEYENCKLELTGANSVNLIIGTTTSAQSRVYTQLKDCTLKFGSTGQVVYFRGFGQVIGGSVDAAGSAPTVLFSVDSECRLWEFEGVNLSKITGTIVALDPTSGAWQIRFTNCWLGTGVKISDAPATYKNKANQQVIAYNCASDDTHHALYHADSFGTTEVSAAIYANDGASYDGTNRCSWKITTRANCSFYTPYVSPWIEQYNADVATSITPYLEGLRDGSATVIQDDEVWAEFSRQGTIGYPLAVFSNDRMALLGTPANQTSTLAAGDWTGEAGTYSTFKLSAPSAFTPAEIGPLKARVIVGEPSLTIYVDPQVRT
jgi:hypothetical protein